MDIREALSGGDRRSIGRADEMVAYILQNQERFQDLVDGLSDGDPVVRMRCADVAEKVSALHPDWLAPHKDKLIARAAESIQQEVRWHLAQMLPRLDLSEIERSAVTSTLFGYLDDRSRIVVAFAMTALAEFAQDDGALRRKLLPVLRTLVRDGSPAVQSRGRKLLARLGAD